MNIQKLILISDFFTLCLIGCEGKTPDKGGITNSMNDLRNKEPLIFESMSDLRNKLTEVCNEGGLEEAKKYISEEFISQRAIEVGGKTSYIFDVQLRHLDNGNPGDIILNFENNPTAENSRLLMTMILVNTEPNLQLLIRKEL